MLGAQALARLPRRRTAPSLTDKPKGLTSEHMFDTLSSVPPPDRLVAAWVGTTSIPMRIWWRRSTPCTRPFVAANANCCR